MKHLIGFLLVGAMTISPAAIAGDVEAGKQIAEVQCAACHGADGNSTNSIWPKLAGQNAAYLADELHEFKSGKRENASMQPLAAALSDEDIVNVSAYFAAQEGTVGTTDAEAVEAAQDIYRGGIAAQGIPACGACHGPAGEGNPGAAYPRLSGQHADYVDARLKAYKVDGQADDVDATDIMAVIAAKLSDEQIAALASYVQGLGGN